MGELLDRLVEQSVIASADPAAGAEHSYTVLVKLALISVSASLVTSATAANRVARLTIDDGTTVLYQGISGSNHVASTTCRFVWGANGSGLIVSSGANAAAQIPITSVPILMLPGWRIKTVTAAIESDDNWGVMSLVAIAL